MPSKLAHNHASLAEMANSGDHNLTEGHTMSELMQASHQWSSRPADERFTSLLAMGAYMTAVRANSSAKVVPSRKVNFVASPDHKGLTIVGPNGHGYAPTHHAFNQLAVLAGAPAGYLRKLPAELAADNLNYGLQISRDVEDVGVLLTRPITTGAADLSGVIGTSIDVMDPVIRAATGPNYGRIWNHQIVDSLIDRFGDGVTGDWRVPGEFGKAVTVTKDNTTLYAGDQDMFVFLADEQHRVTIENRRNGQPGEMARGFFVWNSEVGSATLGISTFLFDYVCCNRIVWGATEYKEIKIRHTSKAPERFLEEVAPALRIMANSSTSSIVTAVAQAKAARVADVAEFLAKRSYNKAMIRELGEIHMIEEGRPMETLFDITTGLTAYARSIKWQDERVAIERDAGKIMALAA